jgi:uncharacterized protein (DUF983 family)
MTDAYERELARSVDAVGDECPRCKGVGSHYNAYTGGVWECHDCGGTGYIEYDAMDDADSAYERADDYGKEWFDEYHEKFFEDTP